MEESKFSIIFSDLTDPRVDRTKRHKLLDIIGLTICAVLCGADNWVEVAEFGEAREEWLKTFLELPNGIPSHDTLGRVFSMIDGAEFERCFAEWVRQITGLTSIVIAIAGQTSEGPTNLVERYDPQTDTWTKLADKPTAVSEVSAVLLGEKIYVPGGKLADGKVSNCLEVFDPRKGTWESKAELPHSLVNYGITTYEGSLYVFGGWDGESIQNSVLRYYPDADIWKEMSRMPTAKSRASVVTLGERIFVIGGESDNNKDLFIEVYYPMQDVDGEKPWRKYLSLDSDVKFLGGQEISGRLFLFSLTENGDFQIDSYTPENSSWYTYVEKSSTLPDKQSQLCNMSGEVFFLGGMDSEGLPSGKVVRYRAVFTIVLPQINN